MITPEYLIKDDRDIEEYHLRVCLASKDYEMLRQYASRMRCTEEALIQIFINDLVKGRFCESKDMAILANRWYEDAAFMRVLETQLARMPAKIVRFEDGGYLSASGTKEQIESQMAIRFPGRKIEAIT